MPTLDAARDADFSSHHEIPDAIRRFVGVETRRREEAIRALAATDRETDVRLQRIEALVTAGLAEQRRSTAIARSGRSASRTTAMIAGATAATFIASHYDQLADVLRFLGRLFR